MKNAVRYAALAMTMISSTALLGGLLRLLGTYSFAQHRFVPAIVSPFNTLFAAVACLGFGRFYQLLGRTKSDAICKAETEIELVHVGFLFAWFSFLFMVHTMNRPVRSVSVWASAAFVFASVCVVLVGFVTRKKMFRWSAEAVPGDLPKALRFWKGAHFIGFCYAMNLALFGFALKFLGSNWLVPGILFGLSLVFLLLWRPRQMNGSGTQPAFASTI